ncbi:zinc finger protein ZFAT isoform 1 [Cricetulus griseus]|nr:zinc finger protein ZFAT isoform 1 [Cricetulus griseus]
MCKCCNLFSPNQSELLTHVSEKHGEEGVNVDDVIIPLRPLSTPEAPNPSKGGDEKPVSGTSSTVTSQPPEYSWYPALKKKRKAFLGSENLLLPSTGSLSPDPFPAM